MALEHGGRRGAPPRIAVIGTALFVAVVPGTAVVLVPYLLTGWTLGTAWPGAIASRILGTLLIVAALPLFVSFVLRFIREGHGTPAPIAPTRHLVVGGPFRHVRNPGYVAVLGLIVGQALLFGSGAVAVFAAILGLGFHLFVLIYEEPTLRRTYGRAYEDYCRDVPRWLPRLGRQRPTAR